MKAINRGPDCPCGTPGGQFRTGRFAATRARQPMPLILGHMRLDLGQFPHLMPQRLGVAAGELRAAAATLGRLQRLNVVALVGGNQGRSCFSWPGCPPRFFFDLRFGGCGLACGCCVLGGREEFCGVLPFTCRSNVLDPRFQLGNLRQQQADDGLGFRRLAGDDFFGDFQRHALSVAENPSRVQINLSKTRLLGVNGY